MPTIDTDMEPGTAIPFESIPEFLESLSDAELKGFCQQRGYKSHQEGQVFDRKACTEVAQNMLMEEWIADAEKELERLRLKRFQDVPFDVIPAFSESLTDEELKMFCHQRGCESHQEGQAFDRNACIRVVIKMLMEDSDRDKKVEPSEEELERLRLEQFTAATKRVTDGMSPDLVAFMQSFLCDEEEEEGDDTSGDAASRIADLLSAEAREMFHKETENPSISAPKNRPIVMTLTHFSPQATMLEMNPPPDYNLHQQYRKVNKPQGLWLSDETAKGMTWSRFCLNDNFRLERLAYKTDVMIDTSDNVLVLDGSNPKDLVAFHDKFSVHPHYIDWSLVRTVYKGILISPYNRDILDFWSKHSHMQWFFTWDCASACIWDLSCVRQVKRSKLTQIEYSDYQYNIKSFEADAAAEALLKEIEQEEEAAQAKTKKNRMDPRTIFRRELIPEFSETLTDAVLKRLCKKSGHETHQEGHDFDRASYITIVQNKLEVMVLQNKIMKYVVEFRDSARMGTKQRYVKCPSSEEELERFRFEQAQESATEYLVKMPDEHVAMVRSLFIEIEGGDTYGDIRSHVARQISRQVVGRALDMFHEETECPSLSAPTNRPLVITLSHYSPHPIKFESQLTPIDYKLRLAPISYAVNPETTPNKPYGLWLSDETTEGITWPEFCLDKDHNLKRLAYKMDVTVDTSDSILVLDGSTPKDIVAFHDKFSVNSYDIDWSLVRGTYKGILVSPYNQHAFDFWGIHGNMRWFFTWDCASACIWDMSCVRQVTRSERTQIDSWNHSAKSIEAGSAEADTTAEASWKEMKQEVKAAQSKTEKNRRKKQRQKAKRKQIRSMEADKAAEALLKEIDQEEEAAQAKKEKKREKKKRQKAKQQQAQLKKDMGQSDKAEAK